MFGKGVYFADVSTSISTRDELHDLSNDPADDVQGISLSRPSSNAD